MDADGRLSSPTASTNGGVNSPGGSTPLGGVQVSGNSLTLDYVFQQGSYQGKFLVPLQRN